LENTCIYGDVIKLNSKEVQCEEEQWTELDKDGFQRILVNKALKLVLEIEKFLAQERSCRFTKKSSIARDWFVDKI
jgi:hypothetical protein